jgi:VanZ family protein
MAWAIWRLRRWAYAAYMIFAVARIPARTGFELHAPRCDTRLTLHNAGLSLTKVPHVVLFGFFFLLTAAQFDRVNRAMIGWSLVATIALGLLVEYEEGATQTGNCRLTDVLPDILGAVLAAVLVMIISSLWRKMVNQK